VIGLWSLARLSWDGTFSWGALASPRASVGASKAASDKWRSMDTIPSRIVWQALDTTPIPVNVVPKVAVTRKRYFSFTDKVKLPVPPK
jgi:hypothetical protein